MPGLRHVRFILPDRINHGRLRLPAERPGKGIPLAFFLIFLCLPVCEAQDSRDVSFPVIARLDSRDTGFRQFIGDVENNRRLVSGRRNRPEEAAAYLTIYQYTPQQNEDIFFLAARCNIPYSALASLNRLNNPVLLEPGKPILLPSYPGIYIPDNMESDLEKLLGATRFTERESVQLRISMTGKTEIFHFFPGADFSPTERVFFLNSGFRFPLQSFRLTSSYGIRESPITGNLTMHEGIDLAAPEGTEVYAVADGVVIDVGEDPVYGTYVIISHGERWTSLYGHLQKVETVLRTNVRSGSLIGRVGSTGQSTGPHLHFELRQDGRALDPAGRLRP
jgi:murein DD-endopeptidase MepM/ murein hydrolase activator NlpD